MTKNDEVRLRRLARTNGYYLRKSRARQWRIDDQQEYRLVDLSINAAVLGTRFDASLEDVEAFLTD